MYIKHNGLYIYTNTVSKIICF